MGEDSLAGSHKRPKKKKKKKRSEPTSYKASMMTRCETHAALYDIVRNIPTSYRLHPFIALLAGFTILYGKREMKIGRESDSPFFTGQQWTVGYQRSLLSHHTYNIEITATTFAFLGKKKHQLMLLLLP